MRKVKILYIEDDEAQRNSFASQLQKHGFQIDTAASGKTGVHKFREQKPDVVLSDLNMPEMNGLDVLKQVKQIDPEVPVIILTAHGSVHYAVNALKQGAYDFVLKPLEINTIATTIHQAMEKVRLQRELLQSQSSLNLLMENVPDIIYALNVKGEFLSVNPATEPLLGYSPEEMIGTSVFNYIYSEDRSNVRKSFSESMQKGDSSIKTLEFRMVTKTGEVKDYEVNRRLIFKNGKVVRQDGIARDVTLRKQFRQELQQYSEDMEQLVEERTQKLEYATRQLASLNAVSNRFTQIYDEDELFEEVPKLIVHYLDFDRAYLILEKNGELELRAVCMEKDPPELIDNFFKMVHSKDFVIPRPIVESFEQNNTIFIQDLNADPRWPKDGEQPIRTKAMVISPIRVSEKPVGLIIGNMQHHVREMDAQDVVRFEMFANMVGLALDNIRAYQSLERKVIARTKSQRQANKKLQEKARELETSTYSLGKANVQLLSAQEQLEKKNAEMESLLQELSESTNRLEAILDSSPSAIIMVNCENKIIASNRRISEFFGFGSEGILDISIENFTDKIKKLFKNPNQFSQCVKELQVQPDRIYSEEGELGQIHERAFRVEKPIARTISIFSYPVLDKKQNELGRVWLFEDITTITQADEQIRAIIDAAPIPFIVSRQEDGKILYANEQMADWLGLSTKGLIGRFTPDFYFDPNDRTVVLQKLKADGFLHNHEVRIKKADGSTHWMIFSIETAEVAGMPVFIGALYDINERKQAEEALRESEEKFRQLTENIQEVFWMVDRESNRMIYVSPSFEEIFGRSVEPLYQDANDWYKTVHQEDLPQLKSGMESAKGRENEQLFRIVHPDHSIRWIRSRAFPVQNTQGEVYRLCGVSEDITEKKLAEEALKQSEAKNRALLDAIPDLMFQMSGDGTILEYKDAGHMGLYVTEKNFLGKKIDEVFSPELAKQTLTNIKRTLATNQPQIFEYQLPFNGSMHDYEARMVLSDENKVLVIVRDITERKQAETALKRERNFVSAVLETAGALVVVLDTGGRIIRFNRACEQTTGYTQDDVVGVPFWDLLLIPQEVTRVRGVFDKLVAGDFPNYNENFWVTKDGTQRLIAWSNTALLSNDGAVEYIVAIGIDITERKQAEEKLKLYHEIFVNSKDAIIVLDPHGRYIEQNPTHRILNGYSDKELLGKTPAMVAGDPTFQEIGKALSEKGSFRGEVKSRPKSGPPKDIELSAFSIYGDDGDVHCHVGFARDITQRKKAEERLANRLRYEEGLAACSRTLLEGRDDEDALQSAINHLLKAADTGRVYIFENFYDDKDGLCMRQTHEVCAPDVKPEIDNPILQHVPYKDGFLRWQKALSQNQPIKGIVETFPREERDILESQSILSILVLPISVDGSWYGFAGFDDVDKKREWGKEDIRMLQTAAEMIGGYIEHKLAEEALRESEERFRNLVENANDIIYSLTLDGKFGYVSPNWTKILGHDISEVQGKPFEPFVHPDDLEECWQFFNKVVQSGENQSGIEYRVRHKDGSWKWHTSSASPLKDANGEILYYIGVAHDITEKKKFLDDLARANKHLRDTQAQLVQSEKMASLGMLVAGIAHEINTPVGAIHSMHDTLKRAVTKLKQNLETKLAEEFRDSPDIYSPLKIIEDANKVIDSGSARVTTIVKRLRSFARLDEAELKTVDIHEGLEDTLTLIHHEIKHNIKLITNYSKLPPISCFPGRLNQVYLNLLINAKQAIKDKGTITVSTSQKDDKIHISIADTGIGIPKEKLKKVFDPGFTTKGVGIGTGLGLSICYQIIEDHKGEIKVESELGKGSTFTIVLPMNLDKLLDPKSPSPQNSQLQ